MLWTDSKFRKFIKHKVVSECLQYQITSLVPYKELLKRIIVVVG